jgi:hypothetical protein
MLTFGLFCLGYASLSLLFGAKVAYFVMVPVSLVLIVLAVSNALMAMTMSAFAQWAKKNEDKLRDTIVIQARGLDN